MHSTGINMSIQALFHYALDYLKLGVGISLIFLIGAFFFCRRKKKRGETVSKIKIFWAFWFIVYLTVLLCATLARDGYETVIKLQPFSSYKAAWNRASAAEWRNLLINILLFIPFGFFVPLLFGKCKKSWITYCLGAGFAVYIECIQLVFHRGIVEFDDMFNNTMGTMIGYGIYMIFAGLVERMRKKNVQLRKIVPYQIPLVVVVVSYVLFFSMYARLEFGTLSCQYSEIVNMSQSNVATQCEFDTESGTDYAYKGKVLTKEECQTFAKDYFSSLGCELDNEQTVFYDNIAIFKTTPTRYILTVTYRGGGYEINDLGEEEEDSFFQDGVTGFSEGEIRKVLHTYQVTLPAGIEVQEVEKGEYRLTADMVQAGDTWWNGTCTVTPISETTVSSFENYMLAFTEQSKVKIISEKEAYDQLLKGKFVLPEGVEEIQNLVIAGVELEYEIDSIGYAQPVYEFLVVLNGDEKNTARIRVPAVA